MIPIDRIGGVSYLRKSSSACQLFTAMQMRMKTSLRPAQFPAFTQMALTAREALVITNLAAIQKFRKNINRWWTVREAIDVLAGQGLVADYMRICGFPFSKTVDEFLHEHDFCFVVEQNRDAQLRSLLILETSIEKERLRPLLVYGGFPLSARHVVDAILSQVEVAHAVHS